MDGIKLENNDNETLLPKVESKSTWGNDTKGIFDQSNPPRLTPTGKISHAKTRVYTQRYRKEWEQTEDFKGWLTSVPNSPTRAYCLYCKKDLHAHRLSLLKHMCTMKHQRSALTYQHIGDMKVNPYHNVTFVKGNSDDTEEEKVEYIMDENLDSHYYIVEQLDENIVYNDDNRDNLENDFEALEYSEHEGSYEDVNEKSLKDMKNSDKFDDSTVESISEMHSQELGDEDQDMEQLEMLVESDDSEMTKTSATYDIKERDTRHLEKFSTLSEKSNDAVPSKKDMAETVVIRQKESQTARKSLNRVILKPAANSTITMSAGNKVVTLKGKKIHGGTKFLLNNLKGNMSTLLLTTKNQNTGNSSTEFSVKDLKEGFIQETSSSSSIIESNEKVANESMSSKTDSMSKRSCISTHVVDTSKGFPIGGLQVSLYKLVDGRWTFLNESCTSPGGRCNDLVDHEKMHFTTGRYKLHFDVDKYFTCRKIETMYPFIEIVFDVKNASGQYHIPILLSPYGYTTYRGSER